MLSPGKLIEAELGPCLMKSLPDQVTTRRWDMVVHFPKDLANQPTVSINVLEKPL